MLFDNRDDSSSENEEVSISPAQSSGSSSGGQREETEIRGKASSSRDKGRDEDSGDSGISIPSAEGDGSAVDENKVSLEDIHEQNKKIIGLLESISGSKTKDTSNDNSDQLKGDIENELL